MNVTLFLGNLRRIVMSALVGSITLLTACGGGGGGGATTTHVIGGSVTGLLGTVVLQSNGVDNLSLSANGAFSFATPVAQGGAYAVTVLTQPAGQTCVVANASGTANATVTNVSIACTSVQHIIGGTVSGLLGALVIQNNGADNLSLSADGAFSFATPVAQGAPYAVTVLTQPASQVCVVANASGTANAAVTNVMIRCTAAGSLTLFAGNMNGIGNADGSAATARFSFPSSLATDGAGNVYVADNHHHTVRKLTPAGLVSLFAGTAGLPGNTNGAGAAARFNRPSAVATDGAGHVYVADTFNAAIRKITPAGVVSTFATSTSLAGPNGMAVDGAGNVYVADSVNTIRKITPAGAVSILAGSAGLPGSTDGTGAAARFNAPWGLATDGAGNVYVADTYNHTVRKITPAGVVSTLAGSAGLPGSTDGSGAAARFSFPQGLASDSAGMVYVADVANTIRRITPEGVVSTLAGSSGQAGSTDGTGAAARFKAPSGVATDSAGNVFVGDVFNHTVRKITPAGAVSTLAGSAGVTGSADGTGAAARFNSPSGMATDGTGVVYLTDTVNQTIRKITPAGVVSTLAGSAGLTGSADGTGAAARFNFPAGVAADSAGNVYVADGNNNAIRKITPAGAVTTLAGSAGVTGGADGNGAAARFNGPSGVATDSVGNVYVADAVNNTIRKITPAGTVSTFAGSAGVFGSADGTGPGASFNVPRGVATDSADNVYVSDGNNHTVRKITPAGTVTTLAGTAGLTGSADGTGATARFNSPGGLAADSAGHVYVTDGSNHTLRKITPAGVVSTVVGVPHLASFAPGPLPGLLSFPGGVAVGGGSLYVTMTNGVARVQFAP